MRQAFAPVGTRLRKAAATEDGGEGVLGFLRLPLCGGEVGGLSRPGAGLSVNSCPGLAPHPARTLGPRQFLPARKEELS
jgi:hypothetical protein